MKRVVKVIALLLALAVVLPLAFCIPEVISAAGEKEDYNAPLKVRYTDSAIRDWTSLEKYDVKGSVPLSDILTLKMGEELKFDIPEIYSGCKIVLQYKVVTSYAADCKFSILMNGMDYVGTVAMLWADASDEYSTDRTGNQYNPEQIRVEDYIYDTIKDYRDAGRDDMLLEAGSITMSALSQDVELKQILFVEEKEVKSYEVTGKETGTDFAMIEAEKYAVKSDSFIRGEAVADQALAPYDTYKKLINAIAENSWSTIGQKVVWEFDIEDTGYYKLGYRYAQSGNSNKPVLRNIEIDGRTPFKEMQEVAFDYTGGAAYQNYTLSKEDGEYYFYLEKGHHTVAMTAVLGDYEKVYEDIRILMSEISDFGMRLKKLTAGESSNNRTWDIDAYIPNAADTIISFADRIDHIYQELEKIGGCEPTFASNLIYASETLRKVAQEPARIPNKTEQINAGDSSANKYLGTVLNYITDSGLSIDRIYFYGDNCELPPAKSGIVAQILDVAKAFMYSFFADSSNDYSADADNGEELTVWVNRSIQYVQVLQRIVDAKYNNVYGTNIRLSIMPSEQKLILSNATGTNPDVVLGVGTSIPFDLAIRGAAKDLTEYEDFLPFYDSQYNVEALVPFVYGDGVYGACETMDFQVLYYRKDIMKNLGLEVPDTWNDVKKMMPTLLRNSMNFYIPLSSSAGYKNYNMTTPFIYQNGGSLYSEDGVEAAIDKQLAMNGFWDMTELYSIYSFDTVVASFYNSFRYGEIPVGISGFNTYVQLLIAAPELAEQWGISLTPGTVDKDGNVIRSQMADLNACMIFDNTDKPDEAWRFMKWWLSEEIQTEFALTLQTTYGSEYRWNTANIETFKQLPYNETDKQIILEQWESQVENIRHPANYMMEREISNIWNDTVLDGKNVIEAVDESTILINREIERKLKEFGFIDEEGNVVKDYATGALDFLHRKLENGGE